MGSPPHSVGVFLSGNQGDPGLDLVMPVKAWEGLKAEDRKALVEYVRDQVRQVQANPDPYTKMPPSAPAYLGFRQEQQAIKDDAWRIRIGHMDVDNYLVPDKTVLNGPDYSEVSRDVPVFVYADPKVDPVYGSALDGSVQQVKDYLVKSLNDADSVEYVEWTRVLKTGVGYQVTVVYRAKNAYGAFIRTDQTFTLNHKGNVTDVKTNER